MSGDQWRFACRECGNVRVADEHTRPEGQGFVCGGCVERRKAFRTLPTSHRDISPWRPCAHCSDPMDCGSWASCHNRCSDSEYNERHPAAPMEAP